MAGASTNSGVVPAEFTRQVADSQVPAEFGPQVSDSQVHNGGIVATNVVQNIQHIHTQAPPAFSTDDSGVATLVGGITHWLKAKVNFRAIHNDVRKKRAENTGDWFIDSPEYKEWKRNKGSVLCGTGIAGAGKTTLMSRVIDDLLREESNDRKICVHNLT